jgi:hypothetical protein
LQRLGRDLGSRILQLRWPRRFCNHITLGSRQHSANTAAKFRILKGFFDKGGISHHFSVVL